MKILAETRIYIVTTIIFSTSIMLAMFDSYHNDSLSRKNTFVVEMSSMSEGLVQHHYDAVMTSRNEGSAK